MRVTDVFPSGVYVISVSKEERKKAEVFADKVVHTDVYGFRNGQGDIELRKRQHLGSKLAEIAVHRHLTSSGLPCTEPDFNIYPRTYKDWSPELKVGDVPVHVKSQDLYSADRWGISWIGERSDVELYGKGSGYVVFCLVSLECNVVLILAAPKVTDLKQKDLLKNPILQRHQALKFAVYYEHLTKLPKEDIWALHAVCKS
jgi:hypothetical protein